MASFESAVGAPLANGQAVREAMNQGFARAELASVADKDATRVYAGASASGSVVKQKVTNAIDNYRAAVNCFLKALPSLSDDRSADLVRAEIRRLLARLGELQTMLTAVDPDAGGGGDEVDADEGAADARRRAVEADADEIRARRFKPGDRVEAQQPGAPNAWRAGVVVDAEDGTDAYRVRYDDDG